MATQRKRNNAARRLQRATDALLRTNHVAVVDIHPAEKQGLINWKNCKSVHASRQLVDAVCDLPRQWTVYLAVFCRTQTGDSYIKGEEIVPQGRYRSEHISAAIIHYHEQLIASCNPNHVIGYGWIASPVGESLDEEQAARVFGAVGAWDEVEPRKNKVA